MERANVFKSNKSQALRLPKPVALPDSVKQVDIVAVGRTRIIAPAGEIWDSWFESEGVTADFMTDREQPADQEREAFIAKPTNEYQSQAVRPADPNLAVRGRSNR